MEHIAHDVGVAAIRLTRAMTQVVSEAVEEVGLTAGEYGVLDHVRQRPGASNADLARYLSVTPQSLGRLTKRLRERGLITHDTAGPGRRQPITSTPAGDALSAATRPVVDAALQDLFAALDAQELASLQRMLSVIAEPPTAEAGPRD